MDRYADVMYFYIKRSTLFKEQHQWQAHAQAFQSLRGMNPGFKPRSIRVNLRVAVEVVNDLIRKAREKDREVEYIRTKLIASEKSVEKHGWVTETPNEMLEGFKERARRDGKLQNFPERKR